MASTSASSVRKSFKYDVFLSFRGEDTRKNFVDNLYHALKQKGIYTYRDDEEIKKGKKISDELIRSIEDSKFYIIVFSKNYASSSWCLDELVKIMECQKMINQTAYPVFYDVEPTEIRKQSGAVGKSFAKHKEEGVERWRDALKEAAGLAGWELKNTFDGHEGKFIQKIVEEISLELRSINSSVDGKLVGMETRAKDVVSSLEIDIDDVRIIGIKGMGGAGKTTLARSVFDQISFRFEGSSFVENVRETSKNPLCGLKFLQKQILSDVLNKQDIIVNGVYEGTHLMKKWICGRKVLVVLDDVDHREQLQALVGEPNWFKPGSRVIITTRDEQVLVAHGVPKHLILGACLLSHEESLCLFSRYAFGREIPIQGYEKLSEQVVCYASGLPLTIEVLGSSLCGKDELHWTDALNRLKTIPLKETLEILELSYKGLEEDYKEIFLDVACILKGWKKEKAIRVLESCGFHARCGLRVLEQKSLVTISDDGYLGMHDHIEEMGKNIDRRFHLNEPHRHSRMWIENEIEYIDVANKGIEEATRCLKVKLVDQVTSKKEFRKLKEGLRNMKKLKFLNVICRTKYDSSYQSDGYDSDSSYHDYKFGEEDWQCLPNGLRYSCWKGNPYKCLPKCLLANNLVGLEDYLPETLRYLCWNGYPYKCLPKCFQATNLVGLEVFSSNIVQLWEGGERKVLKKLRFLNLANCKLINLDFRLLVNLERLTLQWCRRLVELNTRVENSKLKYLSLNRNYKLRNLDLAHAENLETLNVKYCGPLTELRMPVESLMLKHINISWSLETFNPMRYQNLETLDMSGNQLVELHLPVESLKLKHLSLISCELKTLNLTHSKNLETLKVELCDNLVELHMPAENLSLKHISLEHCKLKKLSFMQSTNLKTLRLVNLMDLVELHMPVSNFQLESLNLCCAKLRNLNIEHARCLEILNIHNTDDPVELHDFPVEKLKSLSLQSFKMKTVNLMQAQNLEMLHLKKCENLVELHMPIEIIKLKFFTVCGSKLKNLDIEGAQYLEDLKIQANDDLVELRMPIESPKLRTITISCSKLRTLYIGNHPCLKYLELHDCFNLVEFHTPVGNLSGIVTFKPFLDDQGFPIVGSSGGELHLIARSLCICPLHPENGLPKFHFECIYKELPLSSTRNLANLFSFGLCACTHVASLSGIISGLQRLRKLTLEGSITHFPKEIGQLECLEELTLLSTKMENLPDSIFMLQHLKVLRLESCCFLKQLPEDINRLECLEELRVTDCTSLLDIPNSICEMKRLKCLHLTNCILVEKLPKEIGHLKCLKELNIQGSSITDPPQSIFELDGLLFFP